MKRVAIHQIVRRFDRKHSKVMICRITFLFGHMFEERCLYGSFVGKAYAFHNLDKMKT